MCKSDKPCEKCGACPTCGRGGPTFIPYPVYPQPITWQPQYPYPYTVWYGTSTVGYPPNGTITWSSTGG